MPVTLFLLAHAAMLKSPLKSRARLKLWERGITAGQRSVEGRLWQSESSVSAVEANSWKPLPVQAGSPPGSHDLVLFLFWKSLLVYLLIQDKGAESVANCCNSGFIFSAPYLDLADNCLSSHSSVFPPPLFCCFGAAVFASIRVNGNT